MSPLSPEGQFVTCSEGTFSLLPSKCRLCDPTENFSFMVRTAQLKKVFESIRFIFQSALHDRHIWIHFPEFRPENDTVCAWSFIFEILKPFYSHEVSLSFRLASETSRKSTTSGWPGRGWKKNFDCHYMSRLYSLVFDDEATKISERCAAAGEFEASQQTRKTRQTQKL